MSILNERIKERRLALDLTLLEVAEEIGVKEATMQRYESGAIKNIKHETIEKLASVLHTTPEYLMGWDTQSESSTIPDEETLRYAEELRNRPGMRLLFDATKNCTEEDMRKVADMIKALRGDD